MKLGLVVENIHGRLSYFEKDFPGLSYMLVEIFGVMGLLTRLTKKYCEKLYSVH